MSFFRNDGLIEGTQNAIKECQPYIRQMNTLPLEIRTLVASELVVD